MSIQVSIPEQLYWSLQITDAQPGMARQKMGQLWLTTLLALLGILGDNTTWPNCPTWLKERKTDRLMMILGVWIWITVTPAVRFLAYILTHPSVPQGPGGEGNNDQRPARRNKLANKTVYDRQTPVISPIIQNHCDDRRAWTDYDRLGMHRLMPTVQSPIDDNRLDHNQFGFANRTERTEARPRQFMKLATYWYNGTNLI